MRINVRTREDLRNNIKNYFVKNPNSKKSDVVNHFVKQGFKRSTIFNNINRVQESSSIKDKKKTGRKSSFTVVKLTKLRKLAKNRVGVSQRDLARQFSTSQNTIWQKLKKMGLNYRRRQIAPKYTEKQLFTIQQRARKLINRIYSEKVEDCEIVMDDEKYFTFSHHDIPKNTGIYTDNIEECPDEVRFKPVEKFPKKVLVWVAMSSRGLSDSFITKSKAEAVNQTIYLEKCLKDRLLPFINKHHGDGKYLFWPDLASAHYAKVVQDWMRVNLKFVDKSENPPNVPQARPIESFWGKLVQRVYDHGWKATSEDQLIRRIRLKLREFDETELQASMRGVKSKIRKLADNGVYALFKDLTIND